MKRLLFNFRNLFGLGRLTQSASSYENFTRPQLIKKIQQLESKLNQNGTFDYTELSKRSKRPFDITQYGQRKIALKLAYIGLNYSGFALLKEKNLPSVEREIFLALQKCSLIGNPDDCNYSRGGRTDKGVSGLGQVISLNVRSSKRKSSETFEDDRDLPYINMINSFLPDDIRILAWAPVSQDFNARFDCTSRTYKYFFKKDKQNLDLMREAASYLTGTHDFRNFCLIDPARNLQHYRREILSFDINHVENDFYEIKLKGSGFLWHQVRYIMSIMFLVGQKLESPLVVKELLNIEKFPSRPDYPLSSGVPLMLYDCEYKNINWIYEHSRQASKTRARLNAPVVSHSHFSQLWESNAIKGLLYKECLNRIEQFPVDSNGKNVSVTDYMDQITDYSKVLLGEGKYITTSKYRPLLERTLSDTDAVKKEKYRIKQLEKLKKEQ